MLGETTIFDKLPDKAALEIIVPIEDFK